MPENDSYSETDLLHRIANGDEGAFKIIHTQYEQKLYAMAHKVLQSPAAAQDAVQEIFIKVWVNRDKLQQMDYFPQWLHTISRNYLYNKLRDKAREEIGLTHLVQEKPEYADRVFNEIEIKELIDLVKEAIDHLSPQQRKVFEMSRQQGLKHREIAAQLKLSQETVKKHMTEALSHIRHYLERYGKHINLVMLLYLTRH